MDHLPLNRLLQREEIDIDLQEIAAYLKGQTVLVTGAGGSIGSELLSWLTSSGPTGSL